MKSDESGNKYVQKIINILMNVYVSAKIFADHKAV